MAFTRTPGGLVEKWNFHQVPTVWVEGRTDFHFYKPISDNLPCRLESFDGIKNARALIKALIKKNLPYLVIVDGDYSILKEEENPHRWVIILSRYSFENYLWEPELVNQVCLRYVQCGNQKDLIKTTMDTTILKLEKELLPLLVLDVAARRSNPAPEVLPRKIGRLLKKQRSSEIDKEEIKNLIDEKEKKLNIQTVNESREDIEKFLKKRCISHLVKGSLLFGLLRNIFIQAAKEERASKPNISKDSLILMLSSEIWKSYRKGDHIKLKLNFYKKFKEVASHFSKYKNL